MRCGILAAVCVVGTVITPVLVGCNDDNPAPTLTITPSALPSGAGVDIADITSKEITHITKNASDKNEVYISAILVKASPACTG